MITEMKKIPITEESRPFATAEKACPLEELGYVEEEYFQSGTANVYGERDASGKKVPLHTVVRDAPYTTRLLVRRPADKACFSGNVVIEILNASAMLDIDRIWVNSWKRITRGGDIYIGITSKGHVVDALKKYDPVRYAAINWANPAPERPVSEAVRGDRFGFLPQYEAGLFWDMLIDLARLLRSGSPQSPLAGFGKVWLYLAGWSQSGGYLSRVVNSFSYLPENCADGPLFDGYLDAGSGANNAALNSYEVGEPPFRGGKPVSSILCTKEPCIAVNTESENRSVFWYGDFDEPECKFRTWQIPCSSHDARFNLIDYYHRGYGAQALQKLGGAFIWEGFIGEPLNTPYDLIFNAALDALFHWVRDGIPAPHAPKLETRITYAPTDQTGCLVGRECDTFGNVKGGIRYPSADCPTSVCQSYTEREDGGIQMMFGRETPFSPEKLTALYGTLSNYRRLARESADRAAAKGWLLAEDVEEMVERVVQTAAQRGLQ